MKREPPHSTSTPAHAIISVMMQEVLAKTTDSNVPLQEQEYYELRLDDLGSPFQRHFVDDLGAIVRCRFLIREAYAAWSEIDRNIMWDGYEHDECATLEEAQMRYDARRAAIASKGFVCSDMDI